MIKSDEVLIYGMSEEIFVCLYMIENHNDNPGKVEDKINEARRLYRTIKTTLKEKT